MDELSEAFDVALGVKDSAVKVLEEDRPPKMGARVLLPVKRRGLAS